MFAVFVFVSVLVIGSGVFISAIRLQRKALATQKLLDEVSYAAEYMSRAIRMAKKDIDGNCTGIAKSNYSKNGSKIKFENYKGECQEFFREWDATKGVHRLKEKKTGIENYLTSPDFDMVFFNIGPDDSWSQDDNEQPRVSFFLELEGKTQEKPKIQLQTSVSQRNLDIKI